MIKVIQEEILCVKYMYIVIKEIREIKHFPGRKSNLYKQLNH